MTGYDKDSKQTEKKDNYKHPSYGKAAMTFFIFDFKLLKTYSIKVFFMVEFFLSFFIVKFHKYKSYCTYNFILNSLSSFKNQFLFSVIQRNPYLSQFINIKQSTKIINKFRKLVQFYQVDDYHEGGKPTFVINRFHKTTPQHQCNQ